MTTPRAFPLLTFGHSYDEWRFYLLCAGRADDLARFDAVARDIARGNVALGARISRVLAVMRHREGLVDLAAMAIRGDDAALHDLLEVIEHNGGESDSDLLEVFAIVHALQELAAQAAELAEMSAAVIAETVAATLPDYISDLEPPRVVLAGSVDRCAP